MNEPGEVPDEPKPDRPPAAGNPADCPLPRARNRREAEAYARREMTARCLELKLRGWTYGEISRELKINRAHASRLVRDELRRQRERLREQAEDLALLEEMRLERAYKALEPQVLQGKTRAIEVAIKLGERRARLLGLDAPEKSQVDVRYQEMPDDELIEQAKRAGVDVKVLGVTGPGGDPLLLPGEKALPDAVRQEAEAMLRPPPPASDGERPA
jgi:AraC-like DNA-binding protein